MNKKQRLNESIKDYEPRFQGFHDLMPFHVREILLVSSLYDSFILEEDGHLSEHIFTEYSDLYLWYPPRITRVSSGEKALEIIKKRRFDIIISMLRLSDMDVFTFGQRIKEIRSDLPIILLAYESEIHLLNSKEIETSPFDNIFIWTGDTKILLAITKFIEDKANIDHDIQYGDIRVILIIENSRRYYSLFLPMLYSEIMKQTHSLIAEGLNEMHRLLRRRARPKLLLAENYEEGISLYQKYHRNILGIISDIRYNKDGKIDSEAGFKFAQHIKAEDQEMPLLLMSSQVANAYRATEIGVSFLDKNSQSLLQDLRQFIMGQLGFGDFIFRLPNGQEVGRASDMRSMEKMLSQVPDESLEYHASRNHFSNWLMARTEFSLAQKLRPFKISDFENIQGLRNHLLQSVTQLRESKQKGVIIEFSRRRFDPQNSFVRLSTGSLGGKARGIAFIRALLEQSKIRQRFPDIKIDVPKTFVIETNAFDEFLEENGIRKIAFQKDNDEEIAKIFLNSRIPKHIIADLKVFLDNVHYPLAVRSSSLLEDSQFQPFAGLYSTYMIPNSSPDRKVRLNQLCDAIKLVYASTFYKAPKAYLEALSRKFEEEKMAIIIQQLVGRKYDEVFYPSFSGVAQSYNFYPISYLKPEDGIAHVALGLGKMIVDGGKALRFSPAYPNILPQFPKPKDFLDHSQREFYALNLNNPSIYITKKEDSTLVKLELTDAEKHGTLSPVGGVYCSNDNRILDGIHHAGARIINFSHVLKYDVFPIAPILIDLLEIGRQGMGCPVEIEFAVNLRSKPKQRSEFYILQIRPMVKEGEREITEIKKVSKESVICQTSTALGNGVISDIQDIIYVRPENFDASKTIEIAQEVGRLNSNFRGTSRKYLLIGPGRWGTADRWLGIPVSWDQISNARVIVETDLDGFIVEPSQGTHFFHNITSFRIGYFCVKLNNKDFIDWEWLQQQFSIEETKFVKHIRLPTNIEVKIDGRSKKGVAQKPY